MTLADKKREMTKAALSRDVSTYQRLKYEIALEESNGDLLTTPIGASDIHLVVSESIPIPESLEAPSITLDVNTIIPEGVSRDSVQKPSEVSVSTPSGLDDTRLCDITSVSAQSVSLEGAESLSEKLKSTFHVESFEEIAAALAAKESPQVTNQPEETDDASLYPPEKVEASSLISVSKSETVGADSITDVVEYPNNQPQISEVTSEAAPTCPDLPLPEIKGSIIEGAKRICNHCQHEFIGEIPWSAYVDESGEGPIPRCEFCGIGRIMTVVGDSVASAKCYHKCPKCGKTWTHGLVPKDVDVLHGCVIFTQEQAICSSCERIREEVRAEFLRAETHRSESKLLGQTLPKEAVAVMLAEESSCKAMTDQELEEHIRDLDRQSAKILARNKGARKHRAARFDALDDAEKQRMRQEWKEVGQLVHSDKSKKIAEKKAVKEEDKQEKGIQAAMLAFNMSRAEAEVWLAGRKKK